MLIRFEKLELENFKSHRNFKMEFSKLTKIGGTNGSGKSTIGDSISWILYGTDMMGSTLEPEPIGKVDVVIRGSLLLSVDGKTILLERVMKKGKNGFYINEFPKKATEYKKFIEELFDRELFLSIFNPGFFPSQHWKKQREQLMRYVQPPLKADVFKKMNAIRVNLIEDLLKKHSLDDLEAIHKDRFQKTDRDYERALERVKVYTEQLESMKVKHNGSVDRIGLKKRVKEVEAQLQKASKINEDILQASTLMGELQNRMANVRKAILEKKVEIEKLQNEPVEDMCFTCGQVLDSHAIERVESQKLAKLNEWKQEGKDLVAEFEEIKQELYKLQSMHTGREVDTKEMQDKLYNLKSQLDAEEKLKELERQIEKGKSFVEQKRMERNEALSIVEAAKEFREAQAEVQAAQVNELFHSISIKLFDRQKNGEDRPTFEIMYENKPFGKLSTAERMKAGLELIEILQRESKVTAPTFIDNAESVLNIKVPTGQTIIARVQNCDLTIEQEEF